jgi:DNA-binding response OmpR family regulator
MPLESDFRRILVVDDDPHIREILIQRLRTRGGWSVEGASNGDEAIGKFALGDYDLVILDLMMGAVGGNDVFLALQSLAKKPKVIIVSALAELWKRTHGERDAVAVFTKPVEFNKLAAAVETALMR